MHNAVIRYMQTGKSEKVKQGSKNYIIPLKEIIRHKGNFYPTCSLVFRRQYYESYPNFCLNCHVGDYPLVLYLATQKSIFYLSDVMAVYQKGHAGSWTNYYKGCDREKKAEYLQSGITMMEKMNGFTAYRYNSLFKEKITNMKINYGLRNRKMDGLKYSFYKKDLKGVNILRKLRLWIKIYLSPVRMVCLLRRNG